MSLLSLVAEDQFVVADLQEDIWQRYKNRLVTSPRVTSDINTAHWEQLSGYFLHNWLASAIKTPGENASAIEADLTKQGFNYGLLSIEHGGTGHVLVPLRVSRSANQTFIDVYDPNRPCGKVPDPNQYPKVTITGENWSYEMDGGDIWSGTTANDAMAYIPYVGPDGWSKLGTNFSGVVAIIFGGNTNIDQVTDSRGRKLFLPGGHQLDTSSTGLARSLVKLPLYGQGASTRPRSDAPAYALNHAVQVPIAAQAAIERLDKEYADDYGGSGDIFLVNEPDLADLTFQLSANDAEHPVRAMVRQGNQFFEIHITGAAGSIARPTLVVHNPSNIQSNGVGVQSTDLKPLMADFTFGQTLDATSTVRVQQTSPIALVAGAQIRINNTILEVRTKDASTMTSIIEDVTSVTGSTRSAPRQVRLLREE